jgi:hypothetical protein
MAIWSVRVQNGCDHMHGVCDSKVSAKSGHKWGGGGQQGCHRCGSPCGFESRHSRPGVWLQLHCGTDSVHQGVCLASVTLSLGMRKDIQAGACAQRACHSDSTVLAAYTILVPQYDASACSRWRPTLAATHRAMLCVQQCGSEKAAIHLPPPYQTDGAGSCTNGAATNLPWMLDCQTTPTTAYLAKPFPVSQTQPLTEPHLRAAYPHDASTSTHPSPTLAHAGRYRKQLNHLWCSVHKAGAVP